MTCNECHAQFDVSFKNPFFELFQWEKGRTFKYNLEGFKLRFQAMSMGDRLSIILTLLIMFFAVNLLVAGTIAMLKSEPKKKKDITLPKADGHYEVI